MIDDGTVFRYSQTEYMLCCQESMYSWLLDTAWGFDAEIIDESPSIAGVSLQGPTTFSLLKDAHVCVGATVFHSLRHEMLHTKQQSDYYLHSLLWACERDSKLCDGM